MTSPRVVDASVASSPFCSCSSAQAVVELGVGDSATFAPRILTFGRVQELAMASTKTAGYSVELAVVPVREIGVVDVGHSIGKRATPEQLTMSMQRFEIDQNAASRPAAANASQGARSPTG